MKFVSWNVNGIRAAMDKGFREFVTRERPDCLCIQEAKAQPEQVDTQWATDLGYHQVWNCAEKKGYSGTAIWSLTKPSREQLGIGVDEHDREGRVITATFDDFHLVTVYVPNAQRGLTRLDYRMEWDTAFLTYVKKLNRRKPVIFCGDLNCAHQEIDLKNPQANRKNAGFTEQERQGLDHVVAAGFVDSFRYFEQGSDHYTWWTYRNNARERNIGWRIDYFFVSQRMFERVTGASIRPDIYGSDHCPVELTISTA